MDRETEVLSQMRLNKVIGRSIINQHHHLLSINRFGELQNGWNNKSSQSIRDIQGVVASMTPSLMVREIPPRSCGMVTVIGNEASSSESANKHGNCGGWHRWLGGNFASLLKQRPSSRCATISAEDSHLIGSDGGSGPTILVSIPKLVAQMVVINGRSLLFDWNYICPQLTWPSLSHHGVIAV